MQKKKELLFSVTRKDLVVTTFRAGGKGGQHQNKTDSAVRIVHPASGARGESRSERSQTQNKKIAFRRLVESKTFKLWIRVESAARLQGYRDAEAKVKKMMRPENIKVEVGDGQKWKKVEL